MPQPRGRRGRIRFAPRRADHLPHASRKGERAAESRPGWESTIEVAEIRKRQVFREESPARSPDSRVLRKEFGNSGPSTGVEETMVGMFEGEVSPLYPGGASEPIAGARQEFYGHGWFREGR